MFGIGKLITSINEFNLRSNVLYNLIVIGYEDESWFENRVVEIATNRFLEYTKESVIEKFKENIEYIYRYPCLIMKEGDNPDIYLCHISNVTLNERYYEVSFNIFNKNCFKYSDIEPLVSELDIRGPEITRTHWAFKDAHLSELLKSSRSNLSESHKEILEEYLDGFVQKITIEASLIPSFGILGASLTYNSNNEDIESVTDFIQKIFNNKNDKEFLNFYRGHSSSKYRLEPSLFRKKDDGSYHYLENENTIYNELLTQNYSEFDTDSGLVA